MRQFERSLMLQTLDQHWREHLAALDHLRQGIHLRGYAQKNPKQEYKREAFELFSDMLDRIKQDVVQGRADGAGAHAAGRAGGRGSRDAVSNVQLPARRLRRGAGRAAATTATSRSRRRPPFTRAGEKVGRNDPCPCGSGKKYKQCHGRSDSVQRRPRPVADVTSASRLLHRECRSDGRLGRPGGGPDQLPRKTSAVPSLAVRGAPCRSATRRLPPESLLPVAGVTLGAAAGKIKNWDRNDVLLVVCEPGTVAAGVFTQNRFCAAPVIVCREHLARQHARRAAFRALVVNAGNANAGTGAAGPRRRAGRPAPRSRGCSAARRRRCCRSPPA